MYVTRAESQKKLHVSTAFKVMSSEKVPHKEQEEILL